MVSINMVLELVSSILNMLSQVTQGSRRIDEVAAAFMYCISG